MHEPRVRAPQRLGRVVHAVVRRRVQPAVQPRQAADRLGIDPLLVADHHRERADPRASGADVA
ncbi:MAG: hypothetical protein ACK52I_23835 [Pseudomonadota bacterium]